MADNRLPQYAYQPRPFAKMVSLGPPGPLVLVRRKKPLQEVVLVEDISRGLEKPRDIPVYGRDGQDPPKFEYVSERMTVMREASEGAETLAQRRMQLAEDNACPCNCTGFHGCVHNCPCMSLNERRPPYVLIDDTYRLYKYRAIIFECGPECTCPVSCILQTSRNTCGDLQVYYTGPFRNWGVRTNSFIPRGSAVIEFVGDLRRIADEDDEEGENNYAMDISCFEQVSKAGYKKSDRPDCEYTVDPRFRGNVARLLNHSCVPNLKPQCIAYRAEDMELSIKQAHIVFFAMRDIDKGEEITFDYCPSGPTRRVCRCGTPKCKGYLNF